MSKGCFVVKSFVYRRVVATALIAIQAIVPAYAAGADQKFFFRYVTEIGAKTTTPPIDDGEVDQVLPIPEVTLAGIDGNVAGTPISSKSPLPTLATIRKSLVGGETGVVYDALSPSIPGMTFDASTGVLSGVPTAEYNGTAVLTYHDAAARVGRIRIPVSIYPHPALSSPQNAYDLPQKAQAAAYDIHVEPSNDGFYTGVDYSLAPGSQALPAGLTMSDGVISGVTTAAPGEYAVVIRGASRTNPAVYAEKAITLTIVVSQAMSLDLKPDAPLVWQFDEANAMIVARDVFKPAPTPKGTFASPLSWSLSDAPAWMTIGSDGQLGGAAPARGTYTARVVVKDAQQESAYDDVTVKVVKDGYVFLSPGIQHLSPRTGETFATRPPTVSNNVGSYGFSAEMLPSNVTIDATTGVSTGRFDEAGGWFWRLRVKDEEGRRDANGKVAGTNYLQIVDVIPPVAIADASSAVGGTQASVADPLKIQWKAPSNLIGTPEYSILGTVPGTLYYKKYDDEDTTKLATYVEARGDASGTEVRQTAGETTAQTESRLASDHIVFDPATLTLTGAASQAGTFDLALHVEDDHKTTGYAVNPSDATRTTANSATSGYSHVTVRGHSFIAFNYHGDSETLDQRTSQPTIGTALRDNLSNAAYKDGATWTLASGTLPPGVVAKVSPATDVLSYTGYPTEQGTWPNISWSVTDASGTTIRTTPVTLTVGPRAALALKATPSSTVFLRADGQDAATDVTATNLPDGVPLGTDDWIVTGDVPPGVSFASDDQGLHFTGKAVVAGDYAVHVAAQDALGGTADVDLKFQVGSPFVSVNVGSGDQHLAQFTSPAALSTVLRDSASNAGYVPDHAVWTLVSGSLPPGVAATVSEDTSAIRYSGYPSEQGLWTNIVWQVADAKGNKITTQPVSFTVGPRDALSLSATPAATMAIRVGDDAAMIVSAANLPNGQHLTAADWTVAGTLPEGVTYAVGDNAIVFSGTPVSAGTTDIAITAVDALGQSSSLQVKYKVSSGLIVTNFGGGLQNLSQFTSKPTLNSGVRIAVSNEPYTGGDLTWALISGTLPPGITAVPSDDTSVLRYLGHPTEQGTWSNIVWQATNADGNQVLTPAATFNVGPREDVTLAVTPDTILHVGNGDAVALSVTASRTAFEEVLSADKWTVAGDMPPGVTYAVNGNTLSFSGITSKNGSYPVTVTATDSLGGSKSVVVTFDVSVSFFAINVYGGTATLSQYTSQPTQITAIRDRTSNAAYSDGDLTWTKVSGTLPPGITSGVSAGTDVLYYTGYPTELGTWSNIVWKATDSHGNSVTTAPMSFVVEPRGDIVLTATNDGAQTLMNGDPVAMSVTASNVAFGTMDASDWNVTGDLPEGVTWSTDGKVLTFSGSPKKTGTFAVVVSATDAAGGAGSTTVTFKVESFMSTLTLGGADQVLAQYTSQPTLSHWARYRADNSRYTGGTWSMISGTLPPGVAAIIGSDNGIVTYSGYPSEQGTWPNIVWKVTDPDGNSVTTPAASFTVGPRAALALAASVPSISVDSGTPVSATVTASNVANGPSAQLGWSVSNLPEGVTYTTSNGVLTFAGAPKRTGSFATVVTATDGQASTASATVNFNVSSFMSILTLGGADQVLTQYTSQPTVVQSSRIRASNEKYTGGTWAMVSGTLPPGVVSHIAADSSNVSYSGYPTTQGTWSNIVWKVTDPDGNSILTPAVSFTVGPRAPLTLASNPANGVYATRTGLGIADGALSVSASNLPNGTALTNANWTVTGLPDGVSYAVNGNVLNFTGAPTTGGDYTITVKATDSLSSSVTKTIAFRVGVNLTALYFSGMTQTIMQYVDQPTVWANIRVAASNTTYRGGATYALGSGTLPEGVTVTGAADGSSASFTGYATETGTFDNLVIAVTDDYGNVFNTKPFTLTVTPRAVLTLSAMPGTTRTLQQNVDDAQLTVSPSNLAFGTPIPLSDWTVTGTLPTGVTYSAGATGLVFSGKATNAGTFNVTVVGRDSTAASATIALVFKVTATAPTYSVANYSTGTTVSNTQSIMFGSAPTLTTQAKLKTNSTLYKNVVSWSLASGKLPPGVTAVISADKSTVSYSGAPSEMGTYTFTWMATDAVGAQVASAPVTFIVNGPITQLSANWYSTCGVTSDGAAKCWGRNDTGAAGDGTLADKLIPTQVLTLTSGVQQISTGKNHACAVVADGTVKCWGYNPLGQLGNGLVGNGSSSTFKYTGPTNATQFGTNNKMVAAGDSMTCVLKNTGAVLCVGYNAYGQLGNNSTTDSVTAVTPVGLSSGVAKIATGTNTTCAVMTDGTAKCWGTNRFGQVGDGTNVNKPVPTTVVGLTGVTNITSHSYLNDYGTTCAATTHGIYCWGMGSFGQMGDGVKTNRNLPVAVPGMETAIDVTNGVTNVCGQKADKTVWCWGGGTNGRLGDGTTVDKAAISVPVVNLGPVETVAGGGDHTCATNAAGLTRCWGAGSNGALGNGSTSDQTTALPISY
jgi:alpha-tubulin suppressor-like RCC1 family protein